MTRIEELMAEGLTRVEALREARAERAELARSQQFEKRNSQANTRIGLSIFRLIASILKGLK